MQTAREGDLVKIHFTGMLDDGSVFTTTSGDIPVEFRVGDGSIIKGIDDCIIGMSIGEKRVVDLMPEDAYGERNEALTATVAREEFPADLDPQPGEIYEVKLPTGEEVLLLIVEVTDDAITWDGNHPYAGKKLRFEVELLAIN